MNNLFRNAVVTVAALATSVPAWAASNDAKTVNAAQLIKKVTGKQPTKVNVSDIGTTDVNKQKAYVYSQGVSPAPQEDRQCTVVYQPEPGASFKESVTLTLKFMPSRNNRVLLRKNDAHGNTKTNETFVLMGPVDDGTFVMLKANRDETKIEYGEGAKALTGLAIKKRFVESPEVVDSFYRLVNDIIPACKAEVQHKKAGTAHDLDDDAPPTKQQR